MTPDQNAYARVLTTYMQALHNSDYPKIKGLFSPEGRVHSPFLGEMEPAAFFDRLAQASDENRITPLDVYISAQNTHTATAYFQYDWRVKDGTEITFKVMDLFSFDADTHLVKRLDIIYDTHPVRSTAGNKYE
jgi:hypothetical protein